MANKHDKVKALSCPFCREPADDEENDKRNMIRIEANDPAAMRQVGAKCYEEGDYDAAFEFTQRQLNWEIWIRTTN